MPTSSDHTSDIASAGFAIVENVLMPAEVDRLIDATDTIAAASSSARERSGNVFAIRNLLDISPEVQFLANLPVIRNLITPTLGQEAIPVRGILFDKIPGANWKVPWHQDVTIAVQGKADLDEWGPWSTKAGVLHVQPPSVILERMLSVRLHLDPCTESNGALRVLPGTHLQGRIPEENITTVRATTAEEVCSVGSGGALLMRPLLLHASSPSSTPGHRRVIHLDFAAVNLPTGLHWQAAAQPTKFRNLSAQYK